MIFEDPGPGFPEPQNLYSRVLLGMVVFGMLGMLGIFTDFCTLDKFTETGRPEAKLRQSTPRRIIDELLLPPCFYKFN
jgi:hypothetical protein